MFIFILQNWFFAEQEASVLFLLYLLDITHGIALAQNRNSAKKKMHELLLNIFEASFPAL
jgi:hypothetical protein